MRILIASGIYPPDIGGPAQYARNLYETWKKQGHDVKVAAYRWERAAPPGLRHLLYFTKILRKGWNADLSVVLDTWSAAVPTMYALKLIGKRYVVRTGGDFLWEEYVERTGKMVLFRDFYNTEIDTSLSKLTFKEKLIYRLGGASLRNASSVIFSTKWQKDIFEKAYGLDPRKNSLVENFCAPKTDVIEPEGRSFVAGTRPLKWKNIELLKEAFADARVEIARRGLPDIELDCGKAVYSSFVEKIRRSYAVILASIGDISPNMIYDAIGTGTPFVVTKEIGIADRIKDAAVFVDPLNKKDIIDKIVWIADPANRKAQAEKVQKISFTHSWDEIANEIVAVWKKTKGKI